jgi:hypothetical protein
MSTITVELTIKVKTKFIPSNAEKTNGFISPQMSNFHREVDILGFSAGSYTGLAIHEVINEFACFPGLTKVVAMVEAGHR